MNAQEVALSQARDELERLRGRIAELEAAARWVSVEEGLPTRTDPGGEPEDVEVATDDGGWSAGYCLRGEWWAYGGAGIGRAPWVRYWRYVTLPDCAE